MAQQSQLSAETIGTELIEIKLQTSDFSVIKDLETAYPSFYVFHPETMLFLMSNGLYSWEIGTKIKSADGRKDLEPYGISVHDNSHVFFSTFNNDFMTARQMNSTFQKIWSKYINVEGQTLHQRELKIHCAFIALQVRAETFHLRNLQEELRSILQDRSTFDYFHLQLNNPEGFSSKFLLEKPVSREEFAAALKDFIDWIEKDQS